MNNPHQLARCANAQPITRALILAHLRDADHDFYADCHDNDLSAAINHAQTSLSHATDFDDAPLQQAIRSLTTLYENERAITDWGSEYVKPPWANASPRKERRRPDTSVLKRIAEGRGPREARYEDLVGPLRLTKPNHVCTEKSPSTTQETYEDLLQILMAWNRKVAPIQDRTYEHEKLMLALQARNDLIDQAAERNTLQLLNQPSPQLQEAFSAYRPEIAQFDNQNISDIMIIVIANIRLARPDIDEDLRHAIFQTLFKEAVVRMLFDRGFRARKGEIRMEQKSARDQGDWEKVHRLKEKEREMEREFKAQRASQIIDRIKLARGNLYEKLLDQLLELAILQTGQMEVNADARSPPMISHALGAVSKSIHEDDYWNAEHERNLNIEHLDKMLSLTRNCLHRTKKFAALDVGDASERKRIREYRMDMVGTAAMMMKVVEDTKAIRKISGSVLKSMTEMETGLDAMLGAVTEKYRALEGGLQAIGEEECAL